MGEILVKKKRIWVIGIVAAVLIAAGIGQVSGRKGDVSEVQRSIGESQRYTETEISAAMDAVEAYFEKEFEGCILLELRYDETSDDRSREWQQKYGFDRVMVLISQFYVTSDAEPCWNFGTTYGNFMWIMREVQEGKWEHIDHGY